MIPFAVAFLAGLAALPSPASADNPCADTGRPAGRAHVHVIDGGDPFFDPFQTTICLGDTVEWDNHADRLHTVTHVRCPRADARYDDCAFDSAFDLTPGSTFEHPFADHSGVFDYKCTIHGFTGRIVVLDQTGELPDLVVDSLALFDTALPTSKRLEATVSNLGDGPAAATRILFEYQNVDGGWVRIGEPAVPALNAAASIAINQAWLVANKIGDFPVRVTIDPGGNQLESDDANNARIETIPVHLPSGIAPGIASPEPP